MRLLPREAWGYAVLLIVLFCIAALAARGIILYIRPFVPRDQFYVLAVLVGSLTCGFMLIAGAFGLWSIRFSAEAESRRRIGRIVDAMDYLRDGLLAVDRKGRITGSNPAAREMLRQDPPRDLPIHEAIPHLSAEDAAALAGSRDPCEIEREIAVGGPPRVIRFRSQPSEGMTLLLLSDVTALTAQQRHSRQIARLHLAGQLARGVANDLNGLLCGISGHVALLTRIGLNAPGMHDSLREIDRCTERGRAMAGRLLEMVRPDLWAGRTTDICSDHVQAAVETLRGCLPPQWRIETSLNPVPPVAMPGLQIEQIVVNLGFLATDTLGKPGALRVAVERPGPADAGGASPGRQYAGMVVVTAGSAPSAADAAVTAQAASPADAGVILSLVRSIVEEAGGQLSVHADAEGCPTFRVLLPEGEIPVEHEGAAQFPEELCAYVGQWRVLLAAPRRHQEALDRRLRQLGMTVREMDDIVSVLAAVEDDSCFDAIVLDRVLLRKEAKSLLRAVVKIRPTAGIVVLYEHPDKEDEALTGDIVFESAHAAPDKVVLAMITAKSLAVRRQNASG